MRFPAFAVLFALTGCHSSELWDEVDYELSDTASGWYEGTLDFEAKAKLGLVTVRSESCEDSASLYVDVDRTVTGTLGCDFGGEIGYLYLQLDGQSVDLPLVDGDLTAVYEDEQMQFDWNGAFTDEHHFFGEARGTQGYQGITIAFAGSFEVCAPDPDPPPSDEPDSSYNSNY